MKPANPVRLKVYDRVSIGVGTERDHGTVREILGRGDLVRVAWDLARETYTEEAITLRVVSPVETTYDTDDDLVSYEIPNIF